jgi:squamous cell carcinoma antigen recognized by T-cells 3
MNVSETLDALGVLVGELEQNHYDINLHIKHIRLAQSNDALQSELRSAYETFTTYLAAGDEVWVPLIEAKQLEVNWDSEELRETLEGVLKLFERAEEDYLCLSSLRCAFCASLNFCSHSHSTKTSRISHTRPRVFLEPRVQT